jgi:hypothetical protein
MDPAIQRALNDKLYDKRKVGALEYVTPSFICTVCRAPGCPSLTPDSV